MRLRTALLGLAILLAGCPVAGAAVSHPGLGYDLDSPPPDPNLNSLDLYQPDGAAPGDARPVVVYVHGGGWRNGDKGNRIAAKRDLFTGAGYVFASLNYRLSPEDVGALDPARVRFPDHPDDVGEAIGWLDAHVEEYGGDPTKLLLIGHSAGAHLVDLVSTDPGYVERYGVSPWQLIGTVSLDTDALDVADRIATGGPQARALLYNAFATPAEDAATGAWAAGSPLRWADASDPPFLLVTQAASADRIADNREFALALGQDPNAVFAAPYDHEGINDAVGGAADGAGETAAILDFLARSTSAAVAPRARLDKRPHRRIHATRSRTTIRFRLAADQPQASFECRLDSRRLKPCERRRRVRVGHGRHTFRYRALGERGRPGATRSFRFRVLAAG